MRPRDVVVIGGSAGAISSLMRIVGGLPSTLPASVFVVIHLSPNSPGMLASVLSDSGPLRASTPVDREPIRHGRIYVAVPDHHLLIEDGSVRVVRGPRENRHRPAIDPLFRTAARTYGSRVLGVILSGLQDDGAAGLYAVQQRGGVTIAQAPEDAEWRDMPSHAIEYGHPHYILPAADIARVLVRCAQGYEAEVGMRRKTTTAKKSKGKLSGRTIASVPALSKPETNEHVAYCDEGEGIPSVFACPECHGILWELKDEKMVRFRCRIGHSYGTESLNEELSAASETALWAAVRALEEKAALSRRVAEGMKKELRSSSRLLEQASADAANAHLIRDMIFRQDAELARKHSAPRKKLRPELRKTA